MRIAVDQAKQPVSENAEGSRPGERAPSRKPPGPAMPRLTPSADTKALQGIMQRRSAPRVKQEGAPVQRDAAPTRTVNTTGLPDSLKAGVERLSGVALDDVKVHYNSAKPAQVQAHAYTQGAEIHVASGQEKHLPHEAWHVVQQKQGRVRATRQLKGAALNDDAGLEAEADAMGANASRWAGRREVTGGISGLSVDFLRLPGSGDSAHRFATGPIQRAKWTPQQEEKIVDGIRSIEKEEWTPQMIADWIAVYWPNDVQLIASYLNANLNPADIAQVCDVLINGSLDDVVRGIPTMINDEIVTAEKLFKKVRRGGLLKCETKTDDVLVEKDDIILGGDLGGCDSLGPSQIHVNTRTMNDFFEREEKRGGDTMTTKDEKKTSKQGPLWSLLEKLKELNRNSVEKKSK